jgi:hypothetical protein
MLVGGVVATVAACAATADPQGDALAGSPTATATTSKPSTPPPAPTLDAADASQPEASAPCKTLGTNGKCGIDPQCGCAANETCDVTASSGAVSCVTGGSATLGRPCTQTGDCVAGLTCLYGACRPYCTNARSQCTGAGTELCVEELDNNNKPIANMNTCTITCDPLMPSAVCGTNTCMWFDTLYAPAKVSDCNYPGTQGLNQGCPNSDYDCAPGLACHQAPKHNNNYECEKWCHFSPAVAGECGSGYSCKDVFGAAAPVFNGVHEGLCQPN